MIDPINAPDTDDYIAFMTCHHCRELIEPETEIEYLGWEWHVRCVPSHVLHGQEQERRQDERVGK